MQAFPKYVAELRNRAFVDDIKASMAIAQSPAKRSAISTGGEAWRVASIRCGEKHTMILTVGGSIWVWGSNANGQLGLGEGEEEVNDVFSQSDCFYSFSPLAILNF